ncbi:MAG: NRDE family protein [Xanthomonadales bacterium]|nr:NRDE family protein [Xanthomonadales bacterium]
MCTLSWKPQAGGYVLRFNRDERRERSPAAPPAALQRGGMRFLAPRDGAAGGSWLLVNAAGLSIGLLNHYAAQATTTAGGQLSRGWSAACIRPRRPGCRPFTGTRAQTRRPVC